MKRLALLAVSALLVIPAFAAEEKPARKKEATPAPAAAQAPAAATTDASKLAVEAPAANDSPLVALAKRSPKAPKKGTVVITNATLGGQNAKVTTTASQRPLAVASAPEESGSANDTVATMNRLGRNKAQAAGADKTPMTEAEKARKMEAMGARIENNSLALDDGDPARIEHLQEQTSTQGKTQPQTAPPPKKP